MERNDRDAIEALFGRLAEAEQRNPQRDRDAEALIRQRMAAQPGAPYYLAQTVIVQQQALDAAQARIAELEARSGSAFANPARRPSPFGRTPPQPAERAQPWGAARGGFLAGAAQTAMGVAGGVLLGNLIAGSLFGGFGAHALDYAGGSDGAGAGADTDNSDAGGNDSGNSDTGDFGGDAGDLGGWRFQRGGLGRVT